MKRTKKTYDHRVKFAIARSKNPYLFPELNIPLSTAKNWIHRGVPEVVSIEAFDLEKYQLIEEMQELLIKHRTLEARFNLLLFIFKFLGNDLQYRRFPNGEIKSKITNAIGIAKEIAPLELCLETIGLSKQRYYHWIKRLKNCVLNDHSSCPKISPTKITNDEVDKIKKFVKDPNYSHFSLTSLWLYVRKHAEIVISISSWFRIIRDLSLKREHRKKYFAKPKDGIKAIRPNQIWHIDISVLRFNGVKAYVQAIRDNFSRIILAYRVDENYGATHTTSLISEAFKKAKSFGYMNAPDVISDGGPENVNSAVKELSDENTIRHQVAQIDIQFSNSMIESFFHQLKNRYLYYKDIITVESLRKHVDFYVHEHNETIPFLALNGATPVQVYENASALEKDRQKELDLVKFAIQRRINYHRSLNCSVC